MLKKENAPEKPGTKNGGSIAEKIVQRAKSLTCSVIHKAGNRNSKSRISLREIWVITKYTRSEYTQPEEDSRKYLLVYQKVVPVLVISIFVAQTKGEDDQPTLPRQMLHACSTKEQIQKRLGIRFNF